jgi:hypothetical protein
MPAVTRAATRASPPIIHQLNPPPYGRPLGHLARAPRRRGTNRRTRYARGKSDPVDAEAAARAVLSGEATGLAKVYTGHVDMIRALRIARRSAVKLRTQTLQQMKGADRDRADGPV